MPGYRAARVPSLAAVLAVLWVWEAAGQASPLRKTDLVRLLTNPSLTKADVAQRIRTACLAFEPTGRDRVDLQALGADPGVMAAINECLRKKTVAAAPAAWPPTAQPRPAPAAPPTATGVPPARGAPARPTAAQPTPAQPVAGPSASVQVEPRRLEVVSGEAPARRPVTVTVRDARGTPVPGVRVDFRPLTPEMGVTPFSGQTDRAGRLTMTLPGASLRRSGEIGVFVRGTQLGSLEVTVALREVAVAPGAVAVATREVTVVPPVLSQTRTRFVSAESQRGIAGQALGQPLVLEVRDTTGAPMAGQAVAFAATNGSVTPVSAVTDAKGQVSASVVLGRQAGAAHVTASVGTIRKEVSIAVGPGPARTLLVLRDTVPLGRALALNSTRPVLLRVMARDTFGNDVPVTRLGAGARDPGVLQVARADTAAGVGQLELRARASGSTYLEVEAAGVRQGWSAEVLLPGAGAGAVIALRAGWTGFSYHFLNLALRGSGGPFAEVHFGWTLVAGLRLTTGVTLARLALDTGTVHAPVTLFNGSLRLEYTVLRQGSVRPVVALGGGQYLTRAPDLNGLGRHSSYMWLAGAGLDFPLRDRMMLELRAMSHQMLQTKTQFADAGHVGSLMALTVGFRFGS